MPPETQLRCAAFAEYPCQLIASGNSSCEIQLWNLKSRSPVETFAPTSTTSDSVSSVTFHPDGGQAFGGTFRGLVYVCDINSGKSNIYLPVSRKLASHVSEVTCISSDAVAPNLIVTASADASIKLWDVREANQVRTFKGHMGQVNSAKLSPDGHWVASGGNDRIVQIWDIMSGDSLHKFDAHVAPVTSLLFNPRELKLASAGIDKKTFLWDLETMTQEAETKQEATAIDSVAFDNEGKLLFTASNESLKVWKVEAGCRLLNSVPAKWKGVKDLKVAPDNRSVMTLSAGPKHFTCWWTDFLKAPASPISGGEEEMYMNAGRPDKNPPRRVLSRDNIPNDDIPMGKLTESSNPKFNMMESFSEIRREHKKFCQAMEQKQNNLSPIFHWLSSGNTKAAINAIEQKNDPMVLVDLINMVINTKKVETMSIEFATALLKKASLLAESNYIIHIKTGMSFVSMCVSKFKQEIISLKSISTNQIDIAREERLKKYDDFCEEIKRLVSVKRIQKIRDKYKDEEVGNICAQALSDMKTLLEKIGY